MAQAAAQIVEKPDPSMLRVPAAPISSNGISSRAGPTGCRWCRRPARQVDDFVAALGGEPDFVECKVPPRYGSLTREVLAINMVMAGCKPEYAPVVRAALLALTAKAFNLNGVQATTHMAAPLLSSTARSRARSA